MLGLLRKLAGNRSEADAAARVPAPAKVEAGGAPAFDVHANLHDRDDMPVLDWDAVHAWVESLPEPARPAAWLGCERAWLAHLRDALGPHFRLDEGDTAIVVSSLEPRPARHAVEFMERTLKRILHVLAGVARPAEWGKDLLVVFDDAESYYRYVSKYYPDKGEFAFSSGMCLDRGCGHYVTTKGDLLAIEPVIAHEMTHGRVGHLPLPLWLNEGLAVNTVQRVTNPSPPLHTPQEMHFKHLAFWGPREVQEFWSGKSFRRPDEANMLSYDLARILVDQLSADWPRFAAFANAARYEDGGEAAAREHLGVGLGSLVAAILERAPDASLDPQPETWREPAEHVPAAPPNIT